MKSWMLEVVLTLKTTEKHLNGKNYLLVVVVVVLPFFQEISRKRGNPIMETLLLFSTLSPE